MKHLRKFEELNYSTYMNAADKMASYGQIKKSDDVKSHAKNIAMSIVKNIELDILVGGVKEFPKAKFESARLFNSGKAWTLQVIFKSDDKSHVISSTVLTNGEIKWQDGNKFMNRKSVIKFEQLIEQLGKFQPDFIKFLKEYNLNSSDIKILQRTYYL